MEKTIMIVDNSASMRAMVSIAFRGEGYAVIEATNGQEAIRKLDDQRMHLIICDIYMPVMDGITFVKNVKQMPVHCFTPIIILTTEFEEYKKRQGQAAGAKAWVIKPFRREQMLKVAQKLCLP